MEQRLWNQSWKFTKDSILPTPGTALTKTGTWEEIDLPHTWNGRDGQDGGDDYYRGACWYVKTLDHAEIADDLSQGKEVYLQFEGTNACAKLYVNGTSIASHEGGYSTWRANITPYLTDSAEIALLVDNSLSPSVYPRQADFTFYGGIYRSVFLLIVPAARFDLDYLGAPGLQVTPNLDGDNALITTKAFFFGLSGREKVRFTILDQEAILAQDEISPVDSTASVNQQIKKVHLWNGRKDPYLYTMQAQLLQDDKVLDERMVRFGCRRFTIDPEKGFLLNGASYPLHGAARHQDRPLIGNALEKQHHEEDIGLLCEMGANAVRLAHYQHASYFYDLCDEKGLIVWAEIPYISEHVPEGEANTLSQMRELILQNYNHPCIVCWGLSNEITMHTAPDDTGMIENHKKLNDLVHSLDPTRPTTLAALTTCPVDAPYLKIPDVLSYNHYYGWYMGDLSMYGPFFDDFHQKYPDRAIGISEYGAEALNWHTAHPEAGDYTEEYQALYHEEAIKQLFTRPFIWSTFVWNMFDFAADARSEGGEDGMNHKGLVSFDRTYKKDAFFAYKAWLSQEPFIHICGKRYAKREEALTKVKVYTNLPEAELLVNGKSLGKQKRDDHFFVFYVPNEGESFLLARGIGENGLLVTDTCTIKRVETFHEAYRMQGKGDVLNWFEITMPEGYCSINDKISDIAATLHGKISMVLIIAGVFRRQKKIEKAKKEQAGKKKEEAAPSAGSDTKKMLTNGGMGKMLMTMSVKRVISMMGNAHMEPLGKEEILEINRKLNRIKKKS